VKIIDARVNEIRKEDIQRLSSWADFILMTSSPLDRWQCPNLDVGPLLSCAEGLPKEKLILCGVHGTLFPERMCTLTETNYVIRGEPESAIYDYINKSKWEDTLGVSYRNNGKIIHNIQCPPLNLSDLPYPLYNLINPIHYYYELLGRKFALLETSRGCQYQCPFCLKVMYGKGVRIKPIQQVLDEISFVINRNKFHCIYFIDIDFSFNEQRTTELCNSLIRSDLCFPWACQTRLDNMNEELLTTMYKAGCRLIHFGIETGKHSTQQDIRKEIEVAKARIIIKRAHKLGMATACFFIFGFPHETRRDREETLDLALTLNSTYASFHLLSPYPTTPVFKDHFAEGDFFPECLPDTPVSEVNSWIKYSIFRYYSRPNHILKNIRFYLRDGNILNKIRLYKEFIW